MTENLYKKREYLSFSSIDTLINDPKRWYKEKILGIRENEFKDYFTRGKAVHAVIEHFNNTGEVSRETAYSIVAADVKLEEERIKEKIDDSVVQKLLDEIDVAIDNYFDSNPDRCEQAEYNVWAKMIDGSDFWFNGKIDGIGKDYIEDYKIKSSFTNVDSDFKGDFAKYQWQGHFYMLAYEIETGKKIDLFKIKEILYKKPNLMYLKKEELIEMAKAKGIESPEGTKEQLIERYKLEPITVKEIVIQKNDDMIQAVKDQFRAAYAMYSIAKDMGPSVLLYSMNKPHDEAKID